MVGFCWHLSNNECATCTNRPPWSWNLFWFGQNSGLAVVFAALAKIIYNKTWKSIQSLFPKGGETRSWSTNFALNKVGMTMALVSQQYLKYRSSKAFRNGNGTRPSSNGSIADPIGYSGGTSSTILDEGAWLDEIIVNCWSNLCSAGVMRLE